MTQSIENLNKEIVLKEPNRNLDLKITITEMKNATEAQ